MTTEPAPAQRLVGDVVVPGEGDGITIPSGVIDIDIDGRILGVGTASELGPPAPGTAVRNLGGLLIPGLVNAHAHGPMTLVRSAGDGLELQRWLTEGVWPREGRMTPDDVACGMTLASIEMLRAGVTTSVEMYLFEDVISDAVTRTGGRVHAMGGVISVIAPDRDALDARLDTIASLRAKHGSVDPRRTIGYAAHSLWDLGPERVEIIAQRAQADGAVLHIHLEETETERQQVIDEHGRTATRVLSDIGALDGRVTAAHCVVIDDDDRGLLADHGVGVAHCPTSNLKLGSGIAKVRAMLEAGIAVGVGTDGAASNDNLDLWTDMKLAALLARGTAESAAAMSAAQAFFLATTGAAAAIGDNSIGQLSTGKWADVVRLDLDDPVFAPGVPEDLFPSLVFAAGSAAVTDVWVAGQQVVANGDMTTVDTAAVVAEARRRGGSLVGDS